MSGRAGRRGKDERGICIIMIDEQVSILVVKFVVLPKFESFCIRFHY